MARGRVLARHVSGRHDAANQVELQRLTDVAERAGLRDALAEVNEAAVVDALARRFWKSRDKDEPAQRLRKLWAFLLRRGFPADLVNARLRALWPRWSDALDGLEPATAPRDGTLSFVAFEGDYDIVPEQVAVNNKSLSDAANAVNMRFLTMPRRP